MNDKEKWYTRPAPTPKTKPRMPRKNRAAQFAPFAALTGLETTISETARATQKWVPPDRDTAEILNAQLAEIQRTLSHESTVQIQYFQVDDKKVGGAYITHKGTVKKIDTASKLLTFTDGTIIRINRIKSIVLHK